MPSYTVKGDDGTYTIPNVEKVDKVFHHFEFKGHTVPSTGTVTIKRRAPGAPDGKTSDVGTYDFASPSEVNFAGVVSDWIVTVDSVDTDLIHMTVTSITTGKSDGEGIDPADKAKLDAITDTGSGVIMSSDERAKLDGVAYVTEEDQLLEGLAFGQLYAKTVTAG